MVEESEGHGIVHKLYTSLMLLPTYKYCIIPQLPHIADGEKLYPVRILQKTIALYKYAWPLENSNVLLSYIGQITSR